MSRQRSLSIRAKLVAGFIGAVLVPVVAVGWFSYVRASGSLEAVDYEKLDAIGEIKRMEIVQYFDGLRDDNAVLSHSPLTKAAIRELAAAYRAAGEDVEDPEYLSVHAQYDDFYRMCKDTYQYDDLFLITPEGDIIYTACQEADFGTSLVNGPAAGTSLAKAWEGGKASLTFGDFEFYEISGKPAAFLAGPVTDNGHLLGVLAFQVSLDEINAVMQERTGMGESGETYLVGRDKLMRSDSRFSEESTVLEQKIDTVTCNKALNGESGDEVTPDYRGVPVLSSYRPAQIEGLDWVVLSEIDEAEVLTPVRQLLWAIVVAGAVLGVTFTALGLVLARGIARGIAVVVARIRDIAEGEGDLRQRVPVTSNDELGELATWFNRFADNVQEIIKEVASASEAVGAASQQVAASATEAANGAQAISQVVEQMAQGAERQTEGLGGIRRQMETLSLAIRQVAEGASTSVQTAETSMLNVRETSRAVEEVAQLAQRATVAADTASANAREGAVAVREGVAAMLAIRDGAVESMTLIRGLSERSEAIGEIVSVIEDVAEQTNLLALNAAIEAARAGEHGKGFAVVADEVRKLAERAASSTGEITALIKDIQQGIGEAVRAQELGSERTEEGAKLVERAGEALNNILASSDEVLDIAGSVAASAQQMTASVSEVVGAIEQTSALTQQNGAASQQMAANASEVDREVESVASVAEENAAASEEASASAEEQSAAAQEIAATAEELSASAESLQALVNQFKF